MFVSICSPSEIKTHYLKYEKDANRRQLDTPDMWWEQKSSVTWKKLLDWWSQREKEGRTLVELNQEEEDHVKDWIVCLKSDEDL